MSLPPSRFTVTAVSGEGSDSHHRDARKVYLNPEALKAHKLCTGDVVAITGEKFSDTKVGYL